MIDLLFLPLDFGFDDDEASERLDPDFLIEGAAVSIVAAVVAVELVDGGGAISSKGVSEKKPLTFDTFFSGLPPELST